MGSENWLQDRVVFAPVRWVWVLLRVGKGARALCKACTKSEKLDYI